MEGTSAQGETIVIQTLYLYFEYLTTLIYLHLIFMNVSFYIIAENIK